jgi:menaquinone-specific isochorismate synthase
MARTVIIGAFASLGEAVASLINAIEKQRRSGKIANPALRWEAIIPEIDLLAWLARQPARVRMYCSDRGETRIAAIGIADMICSKDAATAPAEALEVVFSRLAQLPEGARYYGGMRFSRLDQPTDATWRQFGHLRFVLPLIELISDCQKTVMAAQLAPTGNLREAADGLLSQLALLGLPVPLAPAELPLPLSRSNAPERLAWEAMVAQAQAEMAGGALKKVVLARRCTLRFAGRLLPMALLQRLLQVTPESFHFCFNYGDEIAFIGATPERLYRRKGRKLTSEALAGTRRRGSDAVEDRHLAEELLASAKEREEHQLVVASICQTLAPLCQTLSHESVPEVMKLGRVQHLHTSISGELAEGVSDGQLLLALHPTPAMGGDPRDEAMRQIGRLEPFDRGWYAAPIGWVMREQVEFAVAIRCALVEGPHLALFSGAGIMPASQAEQEWQEMENKLENFLHLFR